MFNILPNHKYGSSIVLDSHVFETLIQENDLDIDEGNRRICETCRIPIFSTPYETDANGHFLHKSCVNLPQSLTRHPLHPGELCLHQRSSIHLSNGYRIGCNNCERECREGFFYQCPDDECRFTLDVLCASTSIKIVHRSHKHELIPICSKSKLLNCRACGLKHDGEFYWCGFCDFYLHRDCALLPNTIRYGKHDQHPLNLTYALPKYSFILQKSKACSICHEELSSIKSGGIYFCLSCDYNAHIKCITSDPSSFEPDSSQDVVDGLVHLPMPDERTSLLSCLLDRKTDCSSSNNGIGATKEEKKLLKKQLHDHNLILHDKYGDDPSQLCNACTKPISSSYYSCTDPQCNDFYLHNYCVNLPLQLYHHLSHEIYSKDCGDDHPLHLFSRLSSKLLSMFECISCGQTCNGFGYRCDKCSYKLDVTCALFPETISYDSHKKSHILFLSLGKFLSFTTCSYCKGWIKYEFYYECCSCPNCVLCVSCALLPLNVSHRFDRHPLKLSFTSLSTLKDDDRNFCEICEEGMSNDTDQFYHCEECVTSFHIDCIPCLGECSNVKFGGTIHVRCHDCPLTFIRILFNYSYECGVCKTTIQGQTEDAPYFSDFGPVGESVRVYVHYKVRPFDVAFECIKCCFWLCWKCAEDAWVED